MYVNLHTITFLLNKASISTIFANIIALVRLEFTGSLIAYCIDFDLKYSPSRSSNIF